MDSISSSMIANPRSSVSIQQRSPRARYIRVNDSTASNPIDANLAGFEFGVQDMEDGRRHNIHEGISADDEVRNLRVRLQLCQDFRKQLMKQLADLAAEYEMKLEDTILRVNKDHEMMISRIREEHEQDRDSIQERGNLLLQQTEEEYEAKLRELEGKNSHLQTQLVL